MNKTISAATTDVCVISASFISLFSQLLHHIEVQNLKECVSTLWHRGLKPESHVQDVMQGYSRMHASTDASGHVST